jgi:DMSO/TMAO reductase YedYZ molybdopterin-dependent catalytic subunit
MCVGDINLKFKFILTCLIVAILLPTTTATASANTLQITNQSSQTYTITMQQLAEMPQTSLFAALYCYGNLVTSGAWSGVQLNYLLTQTNLTSEVSSIQFVASDSYTVTLPLELAMAPNVIIASQLDGEPLNGLRLVLPTYNGAAWIDQIVNITMSNLEAHAPPTETEVWTSGNAATNMNQNRQPSPTPALTPKPTPKPTPNNSPIALPANVTEPNPTSQQQTAPNQLLALDRGTMAAIAAVFAVGLSIAIMLTYRSRNKIKDTTHATGNS